MAALRTATLVLLFAFGAKPFCSSRGEIALLAVPILIQVLFNSALAEIDWWAKAQYCLSIQPDRRIELL